LSPGAIILKRSCNMNSINFGNKLPQLALINMILLKCANCNFHEFMMGGTFQKSWGPSWGAQESKTSICEMLLHAHLADLSHTIKMLLLSATLRILRGRGQTNEQILQHGTSGELGWIKILLGVFGRVHPCIRHNCSSTH